MRDTAVLLTCRFEGPWTQEMLCKGTESKHSCGGHRIWGASERWVELSSAGGNLSERRRGRVAPAPKEVGT